jgi:hypothetical protein
MCASSPGRAPARPNFLRFVLTVAAVRAAFAPSVLLPHEAKVDALADGLASRLREQLEPDVLDVAAVQRRYRLADPRAARAVMHEAGTLHVGGRLFARLEDLRRLEAERVRRAAPPAPSSTSRPKRPAKARSKELERGFWRE